MTSTGVAKRLNVERMAERFLRSFVTGRTPVEDEMPRLITLAYILAERMMQRQMERNRQQVDEIRDLLKSTEVKR